MLVPAAIQHRQQGYLLFEVVIALTIFAVGVVGLARALNNSLETATILMRENAVRIGLRSFIEEIRRKATTDMNTETRDDQLDVTFSSQVEDLQIKNRDGTVLNDLYVLHAKANWGEDSDAHEEAVDVYLYKPKLPAAATGAAADPTGTSAAGTPAGSSSTSSGSAGGSK